MCIIIVTILLLLPVNECPDDEYLNKYVRGKVCAAGTKWRDLGIVLMGQDAVIDLDTIRVDYPYNVKECCTRMFTEWRQRTPKASWKQLIEALKEVDLTQLASELEELLLQDSKISQELKGIKWLRICYTAANLTSFTPFNDGRRNQGGTSPPVVGVTP